MKKSDLRSGMIVENRKGGLGIVLLNTTKGDIIGGGVDNQWYETRMWKYFDDLKEDLKGSSEGWDIVKIYNGDDNFCFGSFNTESLKMIWERPVDPIEMTMEEIASKLGIDVNRLKIIK